MGPVEVRPESPEQAQARVQRVVDSCVGVEVQGCLDPREMRGPEWVPSREEEQWAEERAAEWTRQMRVRFPGPWVGDAQDARARAMAGDDAVRRFRGMRRS